MAVMLEQEVESHSTQVEDSLLSDFTFSLEPLAEARHPEIKQGDRETGTQNHTTDRCGIVLITGGQGTCILDAQAYSLEPNTLLILKPHCRLRMTVRSELQGTELLFSQGFLTLNETGLGSMQGAEFFDVAYDHSFMTLTPAQAARLLRIIDDMRQEYQERPLAYGNALRAHLTLLLLQLWRGTGGHLHSKPNLDRNSVAYRYQKLVSEDPRLDRSVSFYAKKLEVSPSHLHELVKEMSGLNPIAIIQREVIQEAKRLLIHTPAQVSEIATGLAFKDASYFGRYFRRNTGMTPGEFRRRSRTALGL